MRILSDEDAKRLCQGMLAGTPSALADLYGARFDWMVSFISSTTRRDEAFALDCVQDAWLRIAGAPASCESAASLDAWLRRVALSAALDRLRSDASRRLRESRAAVTELRDSLRTIESVRAALDSAMDQCAPDERGLLLMRFRAGMTVRQIAAACGLGAAAIESRLRRTIASMREAIDQENRR
ncbi:MAG: sigma-70 family RNA polymerase sigma factor [Phycisphaeraceae bacterium]|nr:sigma-70 family RNA polymerase sigma factor [Phycisphaeraceae bacterium]